MAEHPNVEKIRAMYEGAAKGDFSPWLVAVHPDVDWHFNGRSWIGGDHKGLANVQELFGKLFMASNGTFSTIPRDIVGNDRHVVSIVDASATVGGEEIVTTVALVWTFEDGKAVDVREHIFDVYRVDEVLGETAP
jgi:ketosteroid isomerase-like protein